MSEYGHCSECGMKWGPEHDRLSVHHKPISNGDAAAVVLVLFWLPFLGGLALWLWGQS